MMVRPKIIYAMCLILLSIVISVPLQAALLYQHPWNELSAIFHKISLANWMMITSILTTAYLLFHVSPLLKISAPITFLILAWNNYLVGRYGQDFSSAQTLLGTCLFAGIFAPLLTKDLRHLLNKPQQRWWRRAKRVNKHVDIVLNPYVGSTLQTKTFDLSETGAFVPFENKDWNEIPKVGERLKICMHIGTLRKVKCEAVVVRVVEPKGTYPKGIGIRFTEINSSEKRSLSNFLDH